MSDRWVLILAYHFPPENAIGGLRPFRFYKYLPEHGFKCHVITAADVTVRPDLHAERVVDPFFCPTSHDFGWQKERLIRKVLLPGVVGIQWSSLALNSAEKFLRDTQSDEVTIFSTWPPLGTHLAGWQLSRRHRLPWIADFRDPLADNPANAGLGPQTQVIYSWLERRFLRSADAFLANTDEAQRVVREKYPPLADRVHLLWNGFDPEQRIEPLPLPPRPQRIFSHVGELYEGRTAAPLIEAVAQLISTSRIAPGSLQIQLVGPAAAACLPRESMLREAEAKGWLKVVPKQVPKAEAQQISQTSDGLLIVQPQSAIQVPGKLFDYLQIGRPILAIVPPESSIERVLARSGIPYRAVYTGCSAGAFESALLDYFALPSAAVRASPWFEETFNCRSQTAALAGLIDAAQSRKRPARR